MKHDHAIAPGHAPTPERDAPSWSAASTATEVLQGLDLSGKRYVVTGAASGLGYETARALHEAGAEVVAGVRTPEAATALLGLPRLVVGRLDLMDPASIDTFASRWATPGQALHGLVNCAGVMASPLARDARGHESQFSTNHLGHDRLTRRLWAALGRAGGSRVVAVSSRGHQIAPVDFEDLDFLRRPYDKWIAYGQSKTANVLFAAAVDAIGRASSIRGLALHPGTVLGPLARHLSAEEIDAFSVLDAQGQPIVDPDRDLKTAAQGAATIVWCAAHPQAAQAEGVYFENCRPAPCIAAGSVGIPGVVPWAVDAEAADRLWSVSAAWNDLPVLPG